MAKIIALVVGVTGNIGRNITTQLLQNKDIEVRALIRSLKPSNKKKAQLLSDFKEQGLKLYEGDVLNKESLKEAVKGANAVIASLIGTMEVFIQGQYNLVDVSLDAGVKLFIPTGYSLYTKPLSMEINPMVYGKLQVDDYAEQRGLKYINVQTGILYDFIKVLYFNTESKYLQYPGNGDTVFQATSLLDTGKFVAAIISSPDKWQSIPSKLVVTSEKLSFNLIRQYLKELGQDVKVEQKGTLQELYDSYQQVLKSDPQSFFKWFLPSLQYLTNDPKLQPDYDDNHLFPEVKVENFKDFLIAHPMTEDMDLNRADL